MKKKVESTAVFRKALGRKRLQCETEEYLLMCKILDLQAFGNSIIEIMVG